MVKETVIHCTPIRLTRTGTLLVHTMRRQILAAPTVPACGMRLKVATLPMLDSNTLVPSSSQSKPSIRGLPMPTSGRWQARWLSRRWMVQQYRGRVGERTTSTIANYHHEEDCPMPRKEPTIFDGSSTEWALTTRRLWRSLALTTLDAAMQTGRASMASG